MMGPSVYKLVILVILQILCQLSECNRSGIQISSDGGYSNIVIKFDDKVNQHQCAQYIKYIKVSFIFLQLTH